MHMPPTFGQPPRPFLHKTWMTVSSGPGPPRRSPSFIEGSAQRAVGKSPEVDRNPAVEKERYRRLVVERGAPLDRLLLRVNRIEVIPTGDDVSGDLPGQGR
jgi:hypothetical protein